jgi:hypothetical protein
MLKHVGRHGDRKVAIVFRELPGEEHMCLVVYPDTLPSSIDDTIMKVLESPAGQQENQLANALHRNLLPDGRVILEALHREGMLKKVPTAQVIVTPTPTNSVKLDELNRLVKELETGEEAVKRLEEIDQSQGLVDPAVKRRQEQEFKKRRLQQEQSTPAVQSDTASTLDDRALAADMLSQANKMETEGKGLLAEAARMKKEAERLFPSVIAAPESSTSDKKGKKSTAKKTTVPNAVQ